MDCIIKKSQFFIPLKCMMQSPAHDELQKTKQTLSTCTTDMLTLSKSQKDDIIKPDAIAQT